MGTPPKLKYRHLSEEAKTLARDIVQLKKENKFPNIIQFYYDRERYKGEDIQPLGNNRLLIGKGAYQLLKELELHNLIRLNGYLDEGRITLINELFDAVDDNFKAPETDTPSTSASNIFNFHAPIPGQLGINTGSGTISQTQNLQSSISEFRDLLIKLNINDRETLLLLEDIEKTGSEESAAVFSSRVAYKAMEILANTGGAAAALSALYQLVSHIAR